MSNLNFDALKKQVAALSTAIAGKQAERAAIAAAIAELNARPASKSDLKAMVAAWIDDSASKYAAGLKIILEPFQKNWSRGPTAQNPLELLHRVTSRNASGLAVSQSPEGLFALMGPQIKSALDKAIDDLDLPEGIDRVDRTAQLKSLAAQLGQIDNELAELADLANSAGVVTGDFEVAPEVKEARRLSALAEKRAADEAARKARQAEMPCGDFPTDKETFKPRPSEISEFEKGQVRIDGRAANRGG